jgi:hypothetical protein
MNALNRSLWVTVTGGMGWVGVVVAGRLMPTTFSNSPERFSGFSGSKIVVTLRVPVLTARLRAGSERPEDGSFLEPPSLPTETACNRRVSRLRSVDVSAPIRLLGGSEDREAG